MVLSMLSAQIDIAQELDGTCTGKASLIVVLFVTKADSAGYRRTRCEACPSLLMSVLYSHPPRLRRLVSERRALSKQNLAPAPLLS